MKSKKKKRLERGADMASGDDCFGSYTGIWTEDKYEKPIQDADDL